MADGMGVVSIFCLIAVPLLFFFVFNRFLKRNTVVRQDGQCSLMVIAGSGGHTAEMLRLVSGLGKGRYFPRIYVVAKTDITSVRRISDFERDRSLSNNAQVETKQEESKEQENVKLVVLIFKSALCRIPRSREVGQAWITTFFTTFVSIVASIMVVLRWKPAMVLCNGPGTCVPVCLVVLILRYLRFIPTKVVYVESVCRVYDLSLSGKILHRYVDRTVVQWPELVSKYADTVYVGRLS